MAADALVTLHDAEHRLSNVRLVCITTATGQWAVATPWPADLSRFAIAVTTPQGSRWLAPPQQFEVFEVTSDAPVVRIAAVHVTLPVDIGTVATNVATLDRHDFEQKMQQQQDPVKAMAAVNADPFDALASPAAAQAHGLQPPPGKPPAATLATPARLVTPLSRPQFPAGICHLFGWD